jgi:isopentenyldiphosphate isomerase
MDYYTKELFIPQVDEQDTVIGKVERWKAHREGILHRGFTVGVWYKGRMVCQHRKHPVFDGFVDLTASSHPVYDGETLQDTVDAVEGCLSREWNISPSLLKYRPKLAGKVVYDSRHGEFVEHEVCHLYFTEIEALPHDIPEDVSYGYSLIPVDHLNDPERNPLLRGLAPWVTAMIVADLLKVSPSGDTV